MTHNLVGLELSDFSPKHDCARLGVIELAWRVGPKKVQRLWSDLLGKIELTWVRSSGSFWL